jgi:hypothetical protein
MIKNKYYFELQGNGICINNNKLKSELITNLSFLATSLSPLAIQLDSKYDQHLLSFNSLHDLDKQRYQLLSQANQSLDINLKFNVYLVHATLTVKHKSNEGVWETQMREIYFQKWIDKDGTSVFEKSWTRPVKLADLLEYLVIPNENRVVLREDLDDYLGKIAYKRLELIYR